MKRVNLNIIILGIFLFIIFLGSASFADRSGKQKTLHHEIVQKAQMLTVPFILNKGQVDARVMFYTNTFGATIYVTNEGEIVYSLAHISDGLRTKTQNIIAQTGLSPCDYADATMRKADSDSSPVMRNIVLTEQMAGGKTVNIKEEKTSVTKVNYYKHKDPSRWGKNIPTYEVISFGEVFNGVYLILKAYGNNVEKLFYVKPHASTEEIQIKIHGANSLRVNETGQLEVETPLGNVTFTSPEAYQEINGEKILVAASYHLKEPGMVYGFKVGEYDKTKELVIDPLLASTYLGGSDNDELCSLAIDGDGYIYVAGNTLQSNFPTTGGSYNTGNAGSNIFISKINPTLTSLLASTYFGGSSEDKVRSLLLDQDGNVYITGETNSSDFPTTENAYAGSLNDSDGDVFVSQLDAGLTNLLASTYLGGTSGDYSGDIAIDAEGNIYVTGDTTSADFPVSSEAYKTSLSGSSRDVFVSKLNKELTSLMASTFMGGSSGEYSSAVAIDSKGNIFVAGATGSSDFPTSSGAYDATFNGGEHDIDGFVSKFDKDLTSLLASTYIGGYFNDYINSMAIDSEGNIYVTGGTISSNFPTTTKAYDTTYNFGSDAFVSKLSNDLKTLIASTFLGGSGYPAEAYDYNYGYEHANAIVIASDGKIYLTGSTYSPDFPTTTGSYNASFNGGGADAFISRFDNDLEELLDSTYIGGSNGYDCGKALAIGPEGDVYIAGITNASNFPVTGGVIYANYNGKTDTFISQLDGDLSALLGKISGSLRDDNKNPVKSAKLEIKGKTTKIKRKTFSDENGLFEFGNLEADTYKITATKSGYKKYKAEVALEDGEKKDVKIEMKKKKA